MASHASVSPILFCSPFYVFLLFTLLYFFSFLVLTLLSFIQGPLLNKWNSELFIHNISILLPSFQFFIAHDNSLWLQGYSAYILVSLFSPCLFLASSLWPNNLLSYISFGMFPYIMKTIDFLSETVFSYVSLTEVLFFLNLWIHGNYMTEFKCSYLKYACLLLNVTISSLFLFPLL